MGEEIGWQSYLLPGLLIYYHPIVALNISGIVWVEYLIRTIIVQFMSCWISAYFYGWITIKCKYFMIPPTMIHFIWNQINPRLLGSIYTNTSGWMIGQQWKINGVGLMGCFVYFIVAIIIIIQI
ncbi:unnamed protein product [Rotaria sp. Silwood1]|nr:unnamed protein product [Rotaria sp. Silwood1]CAF1629741.1 unnamed protein product [Rotaria sp. Silwood1]